MPYEKIGKNEPVCIADEVPFDIPDSWEWVRLGSILSVISDGTHKTPHYVSEGVPFLSVQNISGGKFDFTKLKYITQEEHRKLIERIKPQKEDILFCRIGTLGKAIKCTLDFEFSIFVSLGLLRPVNISLTDYIVFAINSPLGDKWIRDNKVGGGTHTYKINLVDIPRMLIPIPPLEEQKRIFDKLSIFEPLFEEYTTKENALSTLNSSFSDLLKKSILQEAVQGKLVPKDENDEPASVLLERIREEKARLVKEGKIKKDKNESVIFRRDNSHYEKCGAEEVCIDEEIPFEIPESWAWCRLSSLTYNIFAGGDKPKDFTKEPTSKNKYPVIANGITNDGILGYTSIPTANANTITVAGRGTIGFSLYRTYEYCPIVRLIVIEQCHEINPQYLQYVLEAFPEKSLGTSIPQLTVPMLKPKLIPVPPITEQEKIVYQIEKLLLAIKLL